MPTRYPLRNGKLWNQYCEINIVEHCNLSCRACSHLSPPISRTVIDADRVYRDLSLLATAYHTDGLKLLGGEPLLHPDLPGIAAAVRASGITERVLVVTNGTLLPRMGPDFWTAVDEVWVSVYKDARMAPDDVAEVRARARQHGVRLRLQPFARFRESVATRGTADAALVKRIYDTCKIAHEWRCHTIAGGYFYKCSKAYFIAKVLGPGNAGGADGIQISGDPSFPEQLLAYLESPEPIPACQRCLGTVGRGFQHELIDRREWLARQEVDTENLIDMRALRIAERSRGLPSVARKAVARLARLA